MQFWRESIFHAHSWRLIKGETVTCYCKCAPFFPDFVSRTCTLEVTLHSATFNVFRLCFKYDTVSKTEPYVCFPHIRISNICSLLVITYTFGQQSTDWEGERLEQGERGFFSFFVFFLKHVWMINYLVLQKGSTGFKEHRQKRHQTSVSSPLSE